MTKIFNKSLYIFALITALALPWQSSQASHITVDIHSDIGLFYEKLAHDGDWVTTKDNGIVWVPTKTPADWRPYTIGHWAYNEDSGWLWISGWSWGWAPFHYGRWFYNNDYGWVWKPGSQWAPAWVAWRYGNGLVGWAPLSPSIKLGTGDQALSEQQLNKGIDRYAWSFVPAKELFSNNLHTKAIIMSARNITLIPSTKSASRYMLGKQMSFDYGIDPQRLASDYGLKIEPTEIIDVTFPEAIDMMHISDNQHAMFRPTIDLQSEIPVPSASQAYHGMALDTLTKQQKNLKSSLEMYHQAEDITLKRIHEEQLSAVNATDKGALLEQQQRERDALDKLHKREVDVLMKRLAREVELHKSVNK